MKFLAALLFTLLALVTPAYAVGPTLDFTDLSQAPRSGNADTAFGQTANVDGAYVTVWGQHLGSSQGTSTITVGGVSARVISWSNATPPACGPANLYNDQQKLQCVIFQVAGSTPTGTQNIAITVGGVTSNVLGLTVASTGTISFAANWQQLQGTMDNLADGDIVYALDGLNLPGGVSVGYAAVYGAGAPMAVVAYPGANVTVGSSSGGVGFGVSHSGTGYWMTYSKFNIWGISEGAAVSLNSNSRLVGSKLQAPLGDGALGTVGTYPFGDSQHISVLGNEFTNCGNAARPDGLYHVLYISGIRWGQPTGNTPYLETDRDIGWNYFHDNAAIRAINIYNGMPYNNPISGHRVHDNLIVNQSSTGIGILKGVVGENWIYNNIVINAGLGPTDGENIGVWLHAGWSGLGWGTMPDSTWPTNSVTLHVYNNTVINSGWSGGGSANGAWAMDTINDWIPDVHNNLTVQTNGNPYIASLTWQYGAVITPSSRWSNNLWFGAGPAPSFEMNAVSADPLFVSANDFHLRPGSPALNAGVVASTSPSRDFDDVSRPLFGAWDIGVYQSSSSVPTIPASAPTGLVVGPRDAPPPPPPLRSWETVPNTAMQTVVWRDANGNTVNDLKGGNTWWNELGDWVGAGYRYDEEAMYVLAPGGHNDPDNAVYKIDISKQTASREAGPTPDLMSVLSAPPSVSPPRVSAIRLPRPYGLPNQRSAWPQVV